MIALLIVAFGNRPAPPVGGTLSAPSLSVDSIDDQGFRVLWSAVTNANQYAYDLATDAGFTSIVTSGTTALLNKTFSGLSDATTYYYRVKSQDTDAVYTDSSYATDSQATDALPEHPFDLTTNNLVIRAGGTPGVDCDYATVDDAYAAIVGNSEGNQFTLLLKNGTHVIKGPEFAPGDGIWMGLISRPYIHLVGESKAGTIIENVAAVGNESLVSTIAYPNTNLIYNLTIHATSCKYCCHFDTNLYEYDQYVIDCDLEHFGGAGLGYEFGCGFHGGQYLHIIRCTTANFGYYGHGNEVNTRDLAKHFEIHVKQSNLDFEFVDYIEYSANTIELLDNTIGLVYLRADTSNYDAHPGSPTDNNGTKPYTAITASGNTVTTVNRDSEAAAMLGTAFNDPTDFL